MNIYEYQAKEILRKQGIRIPKGKPASNPQDAGRIAKEIGGSSWVVKAQVYAGGRGRAGGIKIAKSLKEVKQYTKEILSAPLKTHQGRLAKAVKKVLIEEECNIARELYLAVAIDRFQSKIVIITSSQGGVEIEETALEDPQAIFKEYIDPSLGLMPHQARSLVSKLNITDKDLFEKAVKFMTGLYEVFVQCDCTLAEINPLAITKENDLLALDAKFSFDESAFIRQPEIARMRDLEEELPAETIARANNLSYIGLEGNIGCMVNGAGLAMATLDTIKIYGGEPANFLDVGGGASREMVAEAFNILIGEKKVRTILVNIFGGILKCDVLAEGIVAACRGVKLKVPLVVRLEGTNVERGRQIIQEAGLNIISEPTMREAAQRAVELVRKSQ